MALCQCCYAYSQMSAEELRAVDSLKKVTESDVHDTLKIIAYMNWDNIIYINNPELDVEINEKILNLSDAGLKKSNIGSRERKVYLGYKGMALNNIGLVFIDYGNYIDALKSLQESLQIAEYMKDSSRQASALNNIGMIYDHLRIPEKALEYYDMSMNFTRYDADSYATYYNNVGLCYYEMGDYEKALDCYNKSIIYADSISDFDGKGNTLSNIGLVYKAEGKIDSAILYFNLSIESYLKVNQHIGTAHSLKNIGSCYYEFNEFEKSIEFCERALSAATKWKALMAQKESCDCLYRSYKKIGKLNQALTYHELYMYYRDSLDNTNKNKELIKLDFQFNYSRQHLKDSLEFANQQEVQRLVYVADIDRKKNLQYILFAGIGVLIIVGGLIFRSYQLKKKDNEIIAQQKYEVESQKEIVEEKNKEITDSINYAKRIQEAILPNQDLFRKYLPNSFILYKPKDIVAGDFYWLEHVDEKIIFAVADCTGHGVPGAMVSVVCHNALNRAVKEFGLIEPDKILNKTRDLVIETFEKGDSVKTIKNGDVIRDGMDIALCVLNTKTLELEFSGANNGLYHLHGEELSELLPDKQPIGKYAEVRSFNSQKIKLTKGDLIYLYTDGYADQFGGIHGKKFKYKQLKEILKNNATLKLTEQLDSLDVAFENWKGNLEQVDDVCLMGVRV